MRRKPRPHVDALRGASRLAVEATTGVADLVEAMHQTIGAGPDILGRPLAVPMRLLTGPIYSSIRAVTKMVGATLDTALERLAPVLGQSVPSFERDAILAALNGVLGDYLHEQKNPLAIEMELMHDGAALDIDAPLVANASPKLLVLLHGAAMGERQWLRHGHDHGAALAEALGYTPVYVRYNSGLNISINGRQLAGRLERLARAWPVPVKEIALFGYSMGGLVARSACHYGERSQWRAKLRHLICLGAPHHGTPLERAGNWVDVLLGISRYSAPLARLGKIRSAGVTDLRFGNVLDEDWQGQDRFELGSDGRTPLPLPSGVSCYAIAGTTSASDSDKRAGDGLVPVDSALGYHEKPERTLAFTDRFISHASTHFDLLERLPVYEKIASWL